jgi:glycosyltransferase involved in cell wall biosynthesis
MAQAPEGKETQGLVRADAGTAPRPQPLVTIITPCLNAVATIADNIQSVLEAHETLKRSGWGLEHLIIDGGSVDGTAELVSSHAATQPFCRWLSNITGGPYAAMNAGLQHARGHYIHVLNSDDLLLDPPAYAAFLQEGQDQEARVLIASIGYFRRPGRHLKSLWLVHPIPTNHSTWRQQLFRGLHYPHPGFIAESKAYKDEGFDETYSLSADYKLMQSILLGSTTPQTTMICSKPLVAMAEGGATGNWKAILKGWKQLAAINRELGIRAWGVRRYWGKVKQRLRPLPHQMNVRPTEEANPCLAVPRISPKSERPSQRAPRP